MAGSHTRWRGDTGHVSTQPLVTLLSQHGSGGCRAEPATPKTRRDRAGLVAVLGTGRLCHDGHSSSETLSVLSPPAAPCRGHSEDVSPLPGTAGHDPAAVTAGKAPGTLPCSRDGQEPRAPLLSPVCARGGNGTHDQQPLFTRGENEVQSFGGGSRVTLGSSITLPALWGSGATPATCRDPRS